MKKFIGSIWMKAAAFLTVCICVPIMVLSTVAVVYSVNKNIFSQNDVPFQESSICYDFVLNELAEVRHYVYWNDISGLKDYYDDGNFSYRITDQDGNVVIDTTITDSYMVIEDYYLEEVAPDGTTVNEYTAEGYINLPVQYGGSAYIYYLLYAYSGNIMVLGVASIFMFFVAFFYLMLFAGKTSAGEVKLIGINRMPWDLLISCLIIPIIITCSQFGEVFYYVNQSARYIAMIPICSEVITICGLIIFVSIAARAKVKGWWKNSITYKVIVGVWHFMKWLVFAIPQTWGLALVYCGFTFINFLLAISIPNTGIGPLAFLLLIFIDAMGLAGVIWFAVQLKSLKKGGEAISRGDFNYKVNTIGLWPGLKDHGANLNSAAEGMSKAVEVRMKSERFKTELITNVSHDLKTPLTSIVSYVDLLKKEDIKNETAEGYIEVIERQSMKLKKLTEDLVEASKASSGAITVNREKINIGELVNQSVGEFTERFELAEITPVINLPEKEIFSYTDGRLLWRIFDNLIQNIIKYAQPGTRAYFDLTAAEGKAVIIMKNISREPLNMSAEMLMERFVREDSSRGQSEGNGLGLSIAKSLTDLCGGTFEILLDGDLYKAVITLPLMRPTVQ